MRGYVSRPLHLLDLDPELAEDLPPDRLEAARAELLCRVVAWPQGAQTELLAPADEAGTLGLLLVEGLVTRRVDVAGRRCVELLAPGDLLRPWQDDGDHIVAPIQPSLTALEPVRLAVLDRQVALRLARWPELMATLLARTMRRSRALAGNLALAQVPRVEDRLLVLLWHLADRFGKVTPEGVVVHLKLSHELLGALIGAQRPTVTMALGPLAERGLVRRRADRCWVLFGDPPDLPAVLEPAAAGR